MKYSNLKYKLLEFMGVLVFSMAYSSANAAVMGLVEDTDTEVVGKIYKHSISPDGKFVFATTLSPERLYAFRRDADTGKLTQIQMIEEKDLVPGKNVFFAPQKIVVSPDNKQLYISAGSFGEQSDDELPRADSIVRFDISSEGLLSYHSRLVTSNANLVISPNGRFLFTGNSFQISVIKRGANGNLSLVEKVRTDSNGNEIDARLLAISPDSKTLYVSGGGHDGHLYVYSIDDSSGKLSGLQTFINENITNTSHINPEDTPVKGSGGYGVVVTKNGKFLYSAGGFGDLKVDDRLSISVFKRATDGTLTHYKEVLSPTNSSNSFGLLYGRDIDLLLSPDEKYIYAFDSIVSEIGVWKRNTSTGDLSFIDSIDIGNNMSQKNRMLTSSDGRHLYLEANQQIKVYDLRSDLSIVKSGPTGNIALNGTISYTLAVTNNGPSDAYGVTVTDTLPAGTSFISGTVNSPTGSCSASDQKVTCSMGKFTVDDGYNAIIKVKAPATEGSITNTAKVIADQLDTRTDDNTDSVSTNIGSGGGGSTPTNPTTGSGSGGGSMPLSIMALLSLIAIRRFSAHQLKA